MGNIVMKPSGQILWTYVIIIMFSIYSSGMIELCPMDSIIMEWDGFILANSELLLVLTANTQKHAIYILLWVIPQSLFSVIQWYIFKTIN